MHFSSIQLPAIPCAALPSISSSTHDASSSTTLQAAGEAIDRELEVLRNRKEHLEKLEKDRDALLESLAKMVPANLKSLSGLERNKVYRMLRLQVTPTSEGYEATGAFCTNEPCCPL
jgi:hypothetical protein